MKDKCVWCKSKETVIEVYDWQLCQNCFDNAMKIKPEKQLEEKQSDSITEQLNKDLLENAKKWRIEMNDISDWYHTFWELYKHRSHLFVALCRMSQEWDREEYWFDWYTIIRSRVHQDWLNVWKDWKMFLLMMINEDTWEQISYHLDKEYWDKCWFAKTETQATIEWDWHTSDDVLERLLKI